MKNNELIELFVDQLKGCTLDEILTAVYEAAFIRADDHMGKAAEELGVETKTAYNWKHKIRGNM